MNPNEPSEARNPRVLRKKINAAISFSTSVLVACGIMMWSVFNAWTNVLTFFKEDRAGQAWWIAGILVLLTCVVPFALALWFLVRTLNKYKPSSIETER